MLKVIKNQKYQTGKEVNSAARIGRREAIHSSIRHWRELATAPVKDLLSRDDPGFTVGECALCRRYDANCTRCPLFVKLGDVKCYEIDGLYHKAFHAIRDIRTGFIGCTKAGRDVCIKRFRRAAEKLLNILISCLED